MTHSMSMTTRTRHDTDGHVIAADIVGETHAFSYTTEQKETAQKHHHPCVTLTVMKSG